MKPAFFLFVCLLIAAITNAQKIEQYCEMTAQNKLFSRKVTIDVDQGEERKWISFKDTRVKDDLGKAKSFNSVVDALNFLGRTGWKLVNAFLVTEGSVSVYHYILKREFDKSELVEDQAQAKN
jgi:hypothetical protein